ncbi:hypothetical protein [Phycicoccus sp. Soil802]|uniref:hypothetical protein n=1 Tax=Phycicoccus sp. Soil802 TaxID=1736414 RepID=UPI0007025402|nr:hypothetical protein [Phycicoccus sp. Soil802]KRF29480.1 hypothetical protein ASG91_00125 [Phycicoccus sp. Soil802]
MKYGRDEIEWEELRAAARRCLIELAEDQVITDYSSLNRRLVDDTGFAPFDFNLDRDRAAIGALLGEISRESYADCGVMLSVLVTHRGGTDEGAGFYRLATDLGALPARPSPAQKDTFMSDQVMRSWDLYRRR